MATPKNAVEASALKRAREDASRLLSHLQGMCLDHGLLLPPEGPASATAGKNCSVPCIYIYYLFGIFLRSSPARVPIQQVTTQYVLFACQQRPSLILDKGVGVLEQNRCCDRQCLGRVASIFLSFTRLCHEASIILSSALHPRRSQRITQLSNNQMPCAAKL